MGLLLLLLDRDADVDDGLLISSVVATLFGNAAPIFYLGIKEK